MRTCPADDAKYNKDDLEQTPATPCRYLYQAGSTIFTRFGNALESFLYHSSVTGHGRTECRTYASRSIRIIPFSYTHTPSSASETLLSHIHIPHLGSKAFATSRLPGQYHNRGVNCAARITLRFCVHTRTSFDFIFSWTPSVSFLFGALVNREPPTIYGRSLKVLQQP